MNQAYSRLSTTQSYHRLQVGFGGNKLIGFQPISYCAKCKKNTLGRDQINQLIYDFKLEVRRTTSCAMGRWKLDPSTDWYSPKTSPHMVGTRSPTIVRVFV